MFLKKINSERGMKKVIAHIKNFSARLIKVVQKILVTLLLFTLYFFGFGITYFFLIFLNRKILFEPRKRLQTYWRNATPLGDPYRQS